MEREELKGELVRHPTLFRGIGELNQRAIDSDPPGWWEANQDDQPPWSIDRSLTLPPSSGPEDLDEEEDELDQTLLLEWSIENGLDESLVDQMTESEQSQLLNTGSVWVEQAQEWVNLADYVTQGLIDIMTAPDWTSHNID